MLPVNQVLVGDCISIMKGFPAESIDMIMFSPPYWGLRDYGEGTETVWGGSSDCKHEWVKEVCGLVHENRNNLRGSQEEVVGKTGTAWIRKHNQKTVGFCVKCGAWRGQLGLEPNSQMYVDHMVEVCREIKRVLKKTGSMYIVLGDTFMNKQKLGIPWRIRFALNEDGWISRSDIVWHKPNAMPASVKDRLNTTYEMIFHFAKQEKYYYNLDAIREPHTSLKDLGRKRLDTRTPKHDLAVKWDDSDPHRTTTAKLHREGYGVGTLHPLGKNPGDVFQAKKEPYVGNNPHRMRLEKGRYVPLNPRRPSDLSYHLGKNPGDIMSVTKHDLAVGRVGNFGYADPLHVKEYHPKGKNPGDVIRSRTDRRLIQDRPLRPPHHPFRGDGWEGINPNMKPHHKGKNPGDVIQEKTWQRAEEYHRKQGKLRSNGTVAGHYLDLLDVAKHYNSKGKNPGDIVKIAEEKGRPLNPPHHAERKRASDIDRMVYSGGFYHKCGKNPGDIVEDFSSLMNEVMKIYSEVTDVEIQEWEGKAYALDPQHNFRRLALNERKSRVLFEIALDKLGIQGDLRRKLIAYWHNHSTHSLGKNPGDIIKIGMHHGSSLTSGRATHHEGQSIESHPSGSNPGDFWSINTKPFRGAHFAVYPEEICVKPILSSSPLNGIVLDPMCGSGTTLAVAKKLGRRFIGIDLSPHYVDIAIERLLKIGSFDRGSVSRSV